ncbi:DUF2922 domain-containing protein [Clostridium formicaceticum]|uniref:DUF2922 domain-containing protein n=1 Tax=Clostridium formicaceticum TaxID=1497 RepID=A0AAC9WES8_9CLOT|nr:DUF2922 domain-containing protein [Clostridium formicaceticum]AOY75636.1 hypothetical protein BJL90_06855 [Clostridium formicaceticum]ARE85949.1 hypothetical protein CLFO_02650 [Clostridium formicaceticum]
MKKVLEMTFKKEDDSTSKFTLANPRQDITPQEVKAVMESILSENIFRIGGSELVEIDTAKVITTTEEILDLA